MTGCASPARRRPHAHRVRASPHASAPAGRRRSLIRAEDLRAPPAKGVITLHVPACEVMDVQQGDWLRLTVLDDGNTSSRRRPTGPWDRPWLHNTEDCGSKIQRTRLYLYTTTYSMVIWMRVLGWRTSLDRRVSVWR